MKADITSRLRSLFKTQEELWYTLTHRTVDGEWQTSDGTVIEEADTVMSALNKEWEKDIQYPFVFDDYVMEYYNGTGSSYDNRRNTARQFQERGK